MIQPILLAVAFAIVACIYASVGFGGGSSYLALLIFAGYPPDFVRAAALLCNITVTLSGSLRLLRAALVPVRVVAWMCAASIPASFLAGSVNLDVHTFRTLAGLCLTAAGLLLLMPAQHTDAAVSLLTLSHRKAALLALLAGLPLGVLAGLTGIGGGIYLSPLLHLTRIGRTREIAATCSVFILLNSIAGLLGRLTQVTSVTPSHLSTLLVLNAAVLCGGWLGTSWLTQRFDRPIVCRITGILIILVGVGLFVR
jgi:uncharacterized protein